MTTTKHGICKVTVAPVRAADSDRSEIVTQLLFGDFVEVLSVDKPWAHIRHEMDGYEGYMDFKQLAYISPEDYLEGSEAKHPVVGNSPWSVLGPDGLTEVLAGSQLPFLDDDSIRLGSNKYSIENRGRNSHFGPVETALMFLNVPYLWGGRSTYGIDCSGYTQTVARIHGITVPRNASKQVHFGQEVSFEDRQVGDVPFFINQNGVVHHVGVLNSRDTVLHASGWIREDRFDKKGIYRDEFEEYTHSFHSIRRWFEI